MKYQSLLATEASAVDLLIVGRREKEIGFIPNQSLDIGDVGDYLDAIAVEIIGRAPTGTAVCANSVGSLAISCSKGPPARF